jgi:hypothetical protein
MESLFPQPPARVADAASEDVHPVVAAPVAASAVTAGKTPEPNISSDLELSSDDGDDEEEDSEQTLIRERVIRDLLDRKEPGAEAGGLKLVTKFIEAGSGKRGLRLFVMRTDAKCEELRGERACDTQSVKHLSSIFPGKLRAVVFVQNLSRGQMEGRMDFKMGRHVGALLAISVHGFRALVALVLAPPFLALQKKLNDLADNPSTLIYRSVEGFEVYACETLTNREGYVLEILRDGWRLVLLSFLRRCPLTLELEVWNFLGYAPKTWDANTSFLELEDGMHCPVSAFQELARDPEKMFQVLGEIQVSNSRRPAVISNLGSGRLALLGAKPKLQFRLFGGATPAHASSFFDPFRPEQLEQEQTVLSTRRRRPAGKPASDQSGALTAVEPATAAASASGSFSTLPHNDDGKTSNCQATILQGHACALEGCTHVAEDELRLEAHLLEDHCSQSLTAPAKPRASLQKFDKVLSSSSGAASTSSPHCVHFT